MWVLYWSLHFIVALNPNDIDGKVMQACECCNHQNSLSEAEPKDSKYVPKRRGRWRKREKGHRVGTTGYVGVQNHINIIVYTSYRKSS